MQIAKLGVAGVFALAAATACSRHPRAVSPVAQVATVPSKTSFRVVMLEDLSDEKTLPGHVFAARLRDALVAEDGHVIAYAGAPVLGRVVAVERGPSPHLTLAFDAIETTDGQASLGPRITRRIESPSAVGGGPPVEGARPAPVLIAKGTEFQLTLTQPVTINPSPR